MTKPEIILAYHNVTEDLRLPIWLLAHHGGEAEVLHEEEHNFTSFAIHTPEATFKFIGQASLNPNYWMNNKEHLLNANNFWYIVHHGVEPSDAVPFKQLYVRLCDSDGEHNHELYKSWTDDGHIVVTGVNFPLAKPNPRYFQDYMYSLWGFYMRKGYVYQNLNSNLRDAVKTKPHLLTAYHRGYHNSPDEAVLYEREEFLAACNEHVPVHRFPNNEYNYSRILDSYQYLCQWERAEMSGMHDLFDTVAHLSWESRGSVASGFYFYEGDDGYHRDWITEKTVKALLYSFYHIFFIHATNRRQQIWLKENDFWFLNWEFQPSVDRLEYRDLVLGINRTAEYLKNLKQQYKTNEDVHKFLVDKYGHKLDNNYSRFIKMIGAGPDIADTQRFKKLLMERL